MEIRGDQPRRGGKPSPCASEDPGRQPLWICRRRYVDADGFHRAYADGDLMMDQKLAEAGEDVVPEPGESMDGVEVAHTMQGYTLMEENALCDRSAAELAEDSNAPTPIAPSHVANRATRSFTMEVTGSLAYLADSVPRSGFIAQVRLRPSAILQQVTAMREAVSKPHWRENPVFGEAGVTTNRHEDFQG